MPWQGPEQISKDVSGKIGQSKRSRTAFRAFLNEFQVLLQVVGYRGEVHYLVGLCQPYRVYLSQPHELGQGAENGFHGALPFALHVPALWTVHPFYVPFIFFTVVGDRELFLVHLAQTGRSQGTALADLARCPVRFLFRLGTAVEEYFFERDYLALRTYIMVLIFVVDEIIGAALIGTVRWDKAFQPPLFQHCVIFSATIARVGHAVLPIQSTLP